MSKTSALCSLIFTVFFLCLVCNFLYLLLGCVPFVRAHTSWFEQFLLALAATVIVWWSLVRLAAL